MFNPHSLNEQLNKHIEDPQRYTNVWPNSNWDLAQYKQFFEYVDQGLLIQGDRWELGCNAFIINPDWEGDAPYEVEVKKQIKFKVKFKVIHSKDQDNYIKQKYGNEYDWSFEQEEWTKKCLNVRFSDGESVIKKVWIGVKNQNQFIAWTENDFCDRDTCYFCDEENDGDWVDGQEDAVCDCCRKKWRYDEDRDGYVRINKK